MKNTFYRISRFFGHQLKARHSKGYGVHSPYLFHFVRFLMMEKHPYAVFNRIEKERQKLLHSNEIICKTDLGTGVSRKVKVRTIAASSLSSRKMGQLLFRLIENFQFRNVLELGTSLGIATAYLASGNSEIKCCTIEGCPETSRKASEVFNNLELSNIELITGDIAQSLPCVLNELGSVDLVFMDANHTFGAVCSYFAQIEPYLSQNAIVVVDDIYWSPDMTKAWHQLTKSDKVTGAFDLYRAGILFFKPELNKMVYKLRF